MPFPFCTSFFHWPVYTSPSAYLNVPRPDRWLSSHCPSYVGAWKSDKPNGTGKLTTKKGDVFEGQFKDGQIDGQGIARYADGWKFKGIFKEGKRNGKAIEEDKDGNRFEGSYVDDRRDGPFVEKDRNGNVTAKGTYTRGRRQLDK